MSNKTYYGGQAVIEGVMMRGRKHMVTAVKRPGGGLDFDARPLSGLYTSRWRKIPLARGIIVLVEALVLGIQVLMYSANVALEEEEAELTGGTMWLVLIGALVFAVAVFFVGPLFLTRLLDDYITNSLVFHIVEGIIRLAIFLAYLKVVSMMPDIRRVYAYHGAEHKTVNAYEAGVPLDVEHVRNYSTAHVRCGTSFLFAILILAIIIFAIIGRIDLWAMVLSRIVLVPVIAALGYEVTSFSGRHTGNIFVKIIMAPGLLMQKFTTREPDDSMLEVAIAALTRVIELDNAEEAIETAA